MDFLELLKAAILGIVQGVTEWLPISSTGHMTLLDQFLHLGGGEDFVNLFLVVIQLGSILAVVILFFHKLNPFALSKSGAEKKRTWILWLKVLVGIIPVAIAGLLLDDLIDAHLRTPVVIGITLILYGIFFILVERRQDRRREAKVKEVTDMSNVQAFSVGASQIAALIPGVSRSGSTIVGGLLMGLNRKAAAEYSFFMAIPVMVGASGLKALKYVLEYGFSFTAQELLVLLVGTLVAFLVSLVAVKWLMRYLEKHGFTGFGIYRIILGVIVLVYFLILA